MIREIPCGKCDCGIYSIEAMMNKKAREFGALSEEERLKNIPTCKTDKDLKCAGCNDFHEAIIKLDEKVG